MKQFLSDLRDYILSNEELSLNKKIKQ